MVLFEYLAGLPIWLAILISLLVSVLISIAGIVPSTFVTGANIVYFGFAGGLALSIIGEALGAIISFFLYRKGLKKLGEKFNGGTHSIKLLEKLKNTTGMKAFILVLVLRIFPFAPSGFVTLTASISRMGAAAFMVSSTIGKIPALLIEAYSIHTVLSWKMEYQLAVAFFAVGAGICYYYWTTKRKNGGSNNENK